MRIPRHGEERPLGRSFSGLRTQQSCLPHVVEQKIELGYNVLRACGIRHHRRRSDRSGRPGGTGRANSAGRPGRPSGANRTGGTGRPGRANRTGGTGRPGGADRTRSTGVTLRPGGPGRADGARDPLRAGGTRWARHAGHGRRTAGRLALAARTALVAAAGTLIAFHRSNHSFLRGG